ncbi:hypothetical protein LCGC14_0653700 [marine sediment metagenome]|uniref:Uncharacterized protein n=1 Tax=marine sediment metagenome TaxID=412755 RepID=A0A0F9QVJ8_9ZZZZ
MTDMVERVARAMIAEETRMKETLAANLGPTFTCWMPTWETASEIYLVRARAAIAAMREPTEGMLMGGVTAMSAEMPGGKPVTSAVIYGQPGPVFQAMIDAALQEDKP